MPGELTATTPETPTNGDPSPLAREAEHLALTGPFKREPAASGAGARRSQTTDGFHRRLDCVLPRVSLSDCFRRLKSRVTMLPALCWCLLTLAAASERGPVIQWEELTVKNGEKTLLSEVSGSAEPGRLLAVMGPSGSGKSTLVKAVAGRLTGVSSVEGVVKIDGEVSVRGGRDQAAFVAQNDEFYPYSTVRETLTFAARLRLPKTMSIEDKAKVVESAIARTGLGNAADTIVGDGNKIVGCSGGERRRLAIAIELLESPQAIFLDEPTSGLDSYAAERVARTLRKLADDGCTVICVIHQPSGAVFDLFDDLALVAEGRLAYQGPIADVDKFFASVGAPRPSYAAKAEHLLSSVSIDYETKENAAKTRARVLDIVKQFMMKHPRKYLPFVKPAVPTHNGHLLSKPRAGLFEQYRLLYGRAVRDVGRAKGPNLIKASQQLTSALVYGGIYSLDDSQRSIQDRFGLLSLCVIGSTNLAVASTIRTFPREKNIVADERAKGMYGAFPYLLSKIVAELPVVTFLSSLFGAVIYPLANLHNKLPKFLTFLGITTLNTVSASALGLLIGAIAPSQDTALALFPVVIILNVVFNGLNLAVESTPRFLRWLPNLSLCRWSFEGLALNEFRGLRFKPRPRPAPPGTLTGDEALARLDIGGSTIKRTVVAQSLILGGCYLQTYRVLRGSSPRYAKILPKVLSL